MNPTTGAADGYRASTVAVLAYDGVDDLDFFGAWSVLRKAEAAGASDPAGGQLLCSILAPGGNFRTSTGLSVAIDALEIDGGFDAVVVPGGAGATSAALDPTVVRRLRGLRSEGARFYSICSGSIVIGDCGLLNGRTVAIHASKREMLRSVSGVTVVSGLHEDDWLTSIGGSQSSSVKGVAIAFEVVRRYCPAHLAHLRARMEIAPEGKHANA
ncbi:MAG: DJ-1/PfpI family protein [Rhodanobacter sp.]